MPVLKMKIIWKIGLIMAICNQLIYVLIGYLTTTMKVDFEVVFGLGAVTLIILMFGLYLIFRYTREMKFKGAPWFRYLMIGLLTSLLTGILVILLWVVLLSTGLYFGQGVLEYLLSPAPWSTLMWYLLTGFFFSLTYTLLNYLKKKTK
mgnify:CR=1 FL=1